MIKNNKGLTMVSLLATIAIILILSFITISVIIGDKGAVNEAEEVKAESEIEDIKEKVYLSAIKNKDEAGNIDTTKMQEELKEYSIESISTDLENNKIKFEYKGKSYDIDLKQISDTTQGNYYSSTPNAPYLMSGMEPIKWITDEDGNEVEVTTNENDKDWYNYDEKRWANAKTVEDGSYWVWIPRYEYKITYYTDDTKETVSETITKNFIIDINFIQKEKTTPTPGYKIHPAFTDGTDNHFQNGEWDKEISGIWVSKYTMSCETSTDGINWTSKQFSKNNIGNILTEDGKIRCVSKPTTLEDSYNGWLYSAIGYSYANAYNYDREKESHMMKNSEHGAVIYLIYSRYGTGTIRNTVEQLSPNNSTGVGLTYTSLYTANYLADGKEFTEKAYANLENFFEKSECNNLSSTKYVTKYPCNPTLVETEGNSNDNYKYYQENYETKRYGDAMLEIFYYNEDDDIMEGIGTGTSYAGNAYVSDDVQEDDYWRCDKIIVRSISRSNIGFGFSSINGAIDNITKDLITGEVDTIYNQGSSFQVVLIGE